jgi:pimeloyl-ACP methyl ester carboxylesterase
MLMLRRIFLLLALYATTLAPALADEPILLSDPARAKNADRAVVFIHGLMGSPRQSFGDWPRIIAADATALPDHGKMSDLAIYAVDYEANFTSHATLEDAAKGVASELAGSAIFKNHRHIWLVGHSMGGLVLKRTLALWKLQGKTAPYGRILGIGLLGVPAAGAPLADLVRALGVTRVANWLGYNGGLVQDLTTDAGERYLDSLETDWIAIRATRDQGMVRKFTPLVHCGYETKSESLLLENLLGRQYGTVVPKLFVSSVCDEKVGLPVGHMKLTKPESARSQGVGWLRDLIFRSIIAGRQEELVTITTDPRIKSSLAIKVDQLNRDLDPDRIERASGLPLQPERIEYADDKAKQTAAALIPLGGEFKASTKSDLMEEIAKKNSCIAADVSSNRLFIKLKILADTKECSQGQYVCANQSCN